MTTKRSCNILTRTLLLVVIFLIKHSNGIITSNKESGRSGKSQEQTDSIQSKDPIGSGIFFAGGLITSFANIVGCCTIIVITFNKWKKHKPKTLSTSQRYPLYTSVIDLFIALITMPNLFYPMQNDKLLNPKGLCVGIGFSMSMLISMNMMLMAVISIVTYLRICKRRAASLGKYDWKLGITVSVPSILISVITLASNGYGEDNYWCFMNRIDENGGTISMIALIVFAYVVIMITTFCYLNVIKRINSVESMLTSAIFKSSITLKSCSDGLELRSPSFFMNTLGPYQHNSSNLDQKIASNVTRATRKMSSYLFLQSLQYAPIIIYSLCFLYDVIQAWIYILFIILFNLGGVAKTFAFLKNEIFFKQKKYSRYICNNPSKLTYHSRDNSLTYPPKPHASKKCHRLNPSTSSTSSTNSTNSNCISRSVKITSTIDCANTDLTLVDFNIESLRDSITDRNTSYPSDNNDNDNDDNDLDDLDDLEGEDDMNFLIPIIFNPPHLSSNCYNIPETTIQRRNFLTNNDTNITNQTSFDAFLLTVYPNQSGLNLINLASNNGSNTSFISSNESIPDPYFRYNGNNSTYSLEV